MALPVLIGVVIVGGIGYGLYHFFWKGTDPGRQERPGGGSAPPGGAPGARTKRSRRAKPKQSFGQATKPPPAPGPRPPTAPANTAASAPPKRARGHRSGVLPFPDDMPRRLPEISPWPENIDERRPLGPHHSAGFLTVWVVDPGWSGSASILLRNDGDRAAALGASGTREPFAIWEKDGVANRCIGSFRCIGINGDHMLVTAT